MRWVHALFHHRADVRQAAVDPKAPFPLPSWYALYLLPDPDCAEAASVVPHPGPLPLEALPLLVEFLLARSVDDAHLRRAVLAAPLPALLSLLCPPIPTAGEIAAALRDLGAAHGHHPAVATTRAYPLGALFELFWDATPEQGDVFLAHWVEIVLGREDQLPHACATLLYRIGRRRGTWPAWAVRLLAVCCPASLGCTDIPLATRKDAAGALAQRGERAPVMTRRAIGRLLQSPLCRTPGDLLDMPVVIGVLHLAHRQPFDQLADVGWPDVQAALEQRRNRSCRCCACRAPIAPAVGRSSSGCCGHGRGRSIARWPNCRRN